MYIIIISIVAGIIKDKFTLSNVHNISMLTLILIMHLYDMNKVDMFNYHKHPMYLSFVEWDEYNVIQ